MSWVSASFYCLLVPAITTNRGVSSRTFGLEKPRYDAVIFELVRGMRPMAKRVQTPFRQVDTGQESSTHPGLGRFESFRLRAELILISHENLQPGKMSCDARWIRNGMRCVGGRGNRGRLRG